MGIPNRKTKVEQDTMRKIVFNSFLLVIYSGSICSFQGKYEESVVKKDYSGFQVIKTFPETEEKIKLLQSIEDSVEIWTPVAGRMTSVDLTLSPNQIPVVKALLECSGIKYPTTTQDMQRAIEVENIDAGRIRELNGCCAHTSGMSWTQYHSYDTIVKFMDCLSSSYKSVVSVYTIGNSTEGRPLKVMKIGMPGKQKKAIWIDGGIHAREGISQATVTAILGYFVKGAMTLMRRNHRCMPGSNACILKKYDIYIMPVMNPDGYEYSRNYDRMWRKTRSKNPGSSCIGTDANRNWGYEWGGRGASTNPCHQTYRGPYAFSEPETAAARDFILFLSQRSNMELYLTFHSYGQFILHPWAYQRLDHVLDKEHGRVGKLTNKAMGGGYTVGASSKVLYGSLGISTDWARGAAGINYTFNIELPDKGEYGFILPASQIKKVARNALRGTLTMIKEMALFPLMQFEFPNGDTY